jgi:exodeoxyribonuclease-3
MERLAQHKPVIFCGDLNVAHNEIDLARPKPNIGKKGFTAEERAGFQAYIDAGLIDTFRTLHPERSGAYTWWSQMANARARNIGWRIDYFLTSAALQPAIVSADVHMDIMGSDHCPVSLEIDL